MDRYEKALEQARNYYPDNLFLDTIFPELAESEDERIRKLLVWQVHRNIEDETNDLAQSVYDGIKGHDPDLEESIEDWKKCLAYLEKQKEQKPVTREKNFVNNPQTSAEILRHYLNWAENSEEDCPYTWKDLADAIRDGIKALGDQKPAEWSEEDEDNLHNIKLIIENFNSTIPYSGGNLTPSKEYKQELISLLKSLRPQPHWKPSEEQMAALAVAKIGIDTDYELLESLYNDLKKLM